MAYTNVSQHLCRMFPIVGCPALCYIRPANRSEIRTKLNMYACVATFSARIVIDFLIIEKREENKANEMYSTISSPVTRAFKSMMNFARNDFTESKVLSATNENNDPDPVQRQVHNN